MASKTLLPRVVAQEGLIDGVRCSARVVGLTLGPAGRNVIIERDYGGRISRDGVSIARVMELEERLPRLGAELLKNVAVEMSDKAGDGTSLAVTLAAAMIEEGLKARYSDIPVNEIRCGMDRAVAAIDARLCEMATKPNAEMLKRVAETAVNGDLELASITVETLQNTSRDGFISVEAGEGLETEVVHSEGLLIEQGYISSEFSMRSGLIERILVEPLILVTDLVLDSLEPLIPLLEEVYGASRHFLVIAGDVSGKALSALISNDRSGAITAVAVKAPGKEYNRTEKMMDIAIATGAHFISTAQNMRIDDVSLNDLGQAAKVRVGPRNTHIYGGIADPRLLDERRVVLRAQRDAAASEFVREELARRLAWLKGKSTVIKVGGKCDDDIKERRDRAVNCVHSVRSAQSSGVLPGGGYAYLQAISCLQKMNPKSQGERVGVAIVARAVEQPVRLVIDNQGGDISHLVEGARQLAEKDAFFVEGPLDPVSTLRFALSIAASTAKVTISTECVLLET